MKMSDNGEKHIYYIVLSIAFEEAIMTKTTAAVTIK